MVYTVTIKERRNTYVIWYTVTIKGSHKYIIWYTVTIKGSHKYAIWYTDIIKGRHKDVIWYTHITGTCFIKKIRKRSGHIFLE